ncbi:MAG: site-2 protease family protein [Pirellulales bacterium]|nr:site-2 protease family protein [Pirellulales bacterium]
MMIAEPPLTRFDVHFKLFGFPVRISPFFWLAAVVLGLYFAQSAPDEMPTSDRLGLLSIFVVSMFISILVHELGHAFLIRRSGWGSRIILYHFGGLATLESPDRYVPMFNENESKPWRKIAISFAGPAAGFLLAGILIVILYLTVGITFEYSSQQIIGWRMPELKNDRVYQIVHALLALNIFWGLMNLLPVYPLDGGQIARELFTLKNPRKGIEYSLILSAAVGAVAAVIALMWQGGDGVFFALMFGMLAFGSYQTLQRYKQQFGRQSGYDDADWWKR